MEIGRFFDQRYASEDRYWWKAGNRYLTDPDAHPASVLTRSMMREIAGRPPGRALDLGGGEGSDAIRLALLGWRVDLVDISREAAGKTGIFAGQVGVTLNIINSSITDFRPSHVYDLVICNGVLHYVENKARVLRMIQDVTTRGGVNALSMWSSYSPVPAGHLVVPCYPEDEDGTVMRMYSSWDKPLLYFERLKQEASHLDFAPHVHSYIKLVAIKPVTA